MGAQSQVEEIHQLSQIPRWNIATRIAFRVSFVYLGLFVIYFCPLWLQELLQSGVGSTA
jgi:hypothetical protein